MSTSALAPQPEDRPSSAVQPFARLRPGLRRVIHRKGRDLEYRADEILADTEFRLKVAVVIGKAREPLQPYANGICRKVILETRRRLKREVSFVTHAPDGSFQEREVPDSLTPGPAMNAEYLELLVAICSTLTDAEIQLFDLALLQRHSRIDIAAALGILPVTARARLRRLVLKLRGCLVRFRRDPLECSPGKKLRKRLRRRSESKVLPITQEVCCERKRAARSMQDDRRTTVDGRAAQDNSGGEDARNEALKGEEPRRLPGLFPP